MVNALNPPKKSNCQISWKFIAERMFSRCWWPVSVYKEDRLQLPESFIWRPKKGSVDVRSERRFVNWLLNPLWTEAPKDDLRSARARIKTLERLLK